MKMEMFIKFKCGNVAKVHFVAIKHEAEGATDIYLRASLEDQSFLGTSIPIEHYELFEVSNLVMETFDRLANLTLAELENNTFQTRIRIPVKLK